MRPTAIFADGLIRFQLSNQNCHQQGWVISLGPRTENIWINELLDEAGEEAMFAAESVHSMPAREDQSVSDVEKQSRDLLSPESCQGRAEIGTIQHNYSNGKPFLLRFTDQTDIILYPFPF
ncbi:unnamed protein product [Echinostoma caproni]|uniref:Uncharacterized protein n=1 Tax=Echinostoma caproni TaxID=27848 RepID=A0A183ABU0_9TREM|nr:unnamed protein product [Echinostoma caproni]